MNRKPPIAYCLGLIILFACLSISLGGCNQPTNGKPTSVSTPIKKSTAISPTAGIPTPTSITGSDPTATSSTSVEPISTAPINSSEKQCGALYYRQAGQNNEPLLSEAANNNAQQVANCFLQAFQQCVPASIDITVSIRAASITTLHEGGLANVRPLSTKLQADGGPANLYHFSTQSQSDGCAVSEVEQAYSVVAPTPSTPQRCVRVEQSGSDLRFVNCGNVGTITFPLV